MTRYYHMQLPRSNRATMTMEQRATYDMQVDWIRAQVATGRVPRGWQTLVAEQHGCTPALVSQCFRGSHTNRGVIQVAYEFLCRMLGEKPALDAGMTADNLQHTVELIDGQLEQLDQELAGAATRLEGELDMVRAYHVREVDALTKQRMELNERRAAVAGHLERTQMEYDLQYSDAAPVYTPPADPLDEIRRLGVQKPGG